MFTIIFTMAFWTLKYIQTYPSIAPVLAIGKKNFLLCLTLVYSQSLSTLLIQVSLPHLTYLVSTHRKCSVYILKFKLSSLS